MCGGTIEFEQGATVGTCDSCGTKQTLPKLDDEKRANLYDRANHFRRNNDFDKAMSIYENILNEDTNDAEAYWSLVLCKYGIEYVEDPATHKRVPTVNRTQFASVLADEDYKSALEYASIEQKIIYENEAKAIDEIQKGILEISNKEEPFDVFICYKESDNNGRRTPDSVLANDLYHQLTQEGFKVFFSRITLEDKLGTAYEPYIFAALNSAKVMVVLGTKPEYFNAVWVKNEWSRYLALIKKGAKKVLIPAYKDMDPYNLPEEFSYLQAQDMSKLGFMQDLIRGIKKLTAAEQSKTVIKETVVVNNTASAEVTALIKRIFLFLEDGEWENANEYCEKVLDKDPENGEAYLGKLMCDLKVQIRDDLKKFAEPFDDNKYYAKACRFNKEIAKQLEAYNQYIREYNETSRKQTIYEDEQRQRIYLKACDKMKNANTESDFKEVANLFISIKSFLDSEEQAKKCEEEAERYKEKAEKNKEQTKICEEYEKYEEESEETKRCKAFNMANKKMHIAKTEFDFKEAADLFLLAGEKSLAITCLIKAQFATYPDWQELFDKHFFDVIELEYFGSAYKYSPVKLAYDEYKNLGENEIVVKPSNWLSKLFGGKDIEMRRCIRLNKPIETITMMEGLTHKMSWYTAMAYVFKLNQDNFGGFSDWRLPTKEELEILYKSKHENNYANSGKFWSSSIFSSMVTTISFSDGDIGVYDMNYNNYVRIVR